MLNTYKMLEKQGYKVDYIGVNSNGELNIKELEDKITEETALLSVMWANNETGVINPIGKISEIVKSKNKASFLAVKAFKFAGSKDISPVTNLALQYKVVREDKLLNEEIFKPKGNLNLGILDAVFVGTFIYMMNGKKIAEEKYASCIENMVNSDTFKKFIETGKTHHTVQLKSRIELAINEIEKINE